MILNAFHISHYSHSVIQTLTTSIWPAKYEHDCYGAHVIGSRHDILSRVPILPEFGDIRRSIIVGAKLQQAQVDNDLFVVAMSTFNDIEDHV
jgi:hypothetical protein